ncbi:MAG: hypothetical protein MHM6MM_006212 [Cercozoa sp. M6MM]
MKLLASAVVAASSVNAVHFEETGRLPAGMIAFDICMSNNQVGTIPVIINGVGGHIRRTDDGGASSRPVVSDTMIVPMRCAYGSDENKGMMGGLMMVEGAPMQYTETAGEVFEAVDTNDKPRKMFLEVAPEVTPIPGTNGEGFVFAREAIGLGVRRGIYITRDGGKTFKIIRGPKEMKDTAARAVAQLDANTLIVAYGGFPTNERVDTEGLVDEGIVHIPVSERVVVNTSFNAGAAAVSIDATADAARPLTHESTGDLPIPGTYWTRIYKSTDGGETFDLVFASDNDVYPMQMACPSARFCFVALEGAGNRVILRTENACNSFEYAYEDRGFMGINAISCSSPDNCFSVGTGADDSGRFSLGSVLHSNDVGRTWTEVGNLENRHFFGVSAVSDTAVYGVAKSSNADISYVYKLVTDEDSDDSTEHRQDFSDEHVAKLRRMCQQGKGKRFICQYLFGQQ